MNFKITLDSIEPNPCIPVNYQYPLSAALYRVIAKGDAHYAAFLHETGYGKGFKFFTFSQIESPFRMKGDRLYLQRNEFSFRIAFHLPEAIESFIKGLFQSEKIDLADRLSRTSFTVKSIESLPNPLQDHTENEMIQVLLKPLSPVVAGFQDENKVYQFLSPDDPHFADCLVYNWRSKISTCYGEATARSAVLLAEIAPTNQAFKSRLITIKAGTPEETKIRGWMNFEL
ncbi:MAG: CRISPR-associated endoribonuclease Cas6, partial [Tannerellaceae bacterium]|nr:CRISPR-associated endoribonuclease Cas6 [Tannerellaceae bacterium]